MSAFTRELTETNFNIKSEFRKTKKGMILLWWIPISGASGFYLENKPNNGKQTFADGRGNVMIKNRKVISVYF